MSEADFFSAEAKRATAASVKVVETQTSAEVVVAVRARSGRYGVLAYHFGFGLSAAVVLYLLLTPKVYDLGAIALDAVLAFVLGVLISIRFETLLRALSRRTTLDANVEGAARAAFFDLGISRTSGRSGILVFVSLFERRCVVLTDIGLDVKALAPAWPAALDSLDEAVKSRDLPAFRGALERLGPLLESVYPRRADDVNELPDEVQ
jgi:putative membrane protein